MKASHAAPVEGTKFGLVQVGIIVLALVAALVHLVVLNMLMGKIDLLFTLNGLGYLALLAAYFLPQLRSMRGLVRWALIGYTLVTIAAWIFMGERDFIGYTTKLAEAGLIALLLIDARS